MGGNGAWELAKSDRMKIHGIDTVVVGEADELALDLFEDMEKGNAPELMNCFVKNIQDIPVIEGPTVNSLIEAMRSAVRTILFPLISIRKISQVSIYHLRAILAADAPAPMPLSIFTTIRPAAQL